MSLASLTLSEVIKLLEQRNFTGVTPLHWRGGKIQFVEMGRPDRISILGQEVDQEVAGERSKGLTPSTNGR